MLPHLKIYICQCHDLCFLYRCWFGKEVKGVKRKEEYATMNDKTKMEKICIEKGRGYVVPRQSF